MKNIPLIASRPLGQVINNYDIVNELAVIKSPTIIIHGENDPIPLKYAEEIHNSIDNSELITLEK